ncbi:hydroxyacylglutathione hydrolase [Shewanella sp. 202IG2-18]|uniref:hydroxyacylglutathione hydrolase n=1 Tax=Parashewanella hymeniacidonis TaxID=2807618 RepID=UPI001960BB53|nr:hydroxyacylglutathione hydrolase [Parashewanella hymeniacidonis]MBM7073509.1 hydroxyacylglutathione hydrolase [Parashewanella hymeniacidonis]
MFEVKSIPAFNDNYIWCIVTPSNTAYVVDPGTSEPVIKFIEDNNLTLTGILITHHHHDHIGGINDLQKYAGNQLVVYGPDSKYISEITCKVYEADRFKLKNIEEDVEVEVLEIPGHTLDHIAYMINGHLFCGDTLFSAGCGRIFEGTANQMYSALQKLILLPASTLVYPAHEYTLSNLKFAIEVDEQNEHLNEYILKCEQLRKSNIPTLPTTIATEIAINPFLRSNDKVISEKLMFQFPESPQQDAVSRFATLRKWKDNF